MNDPSTLPPELLSKFRSLERRIRRGRLLRGLAGAAILIAGVFLASFVVEAAVGWPVAGLRAVQGVIIGVAGVAALATFLSCRRPLAWTRLAAVVEARFPELGERLVSTVDLQHAAAPGHGSPIWIRWLRDETVQAARPLDFRAAHSLRASYRLTAAGAGLLLLALVPLCASDACSRFGRRLLWAWSPSVHGFALTVEPGNLFVGRGRPAIVTVRLSATDDGVRLPKGATLICQEGAAAPRRHPMEPSEPGTYTFTWSAVEQAVNYRIEAGDQSSATYRLEIVEPVTVRRGGTTIRMEPPSYVNPQVMPPTVQTDSTPFTVLQFSRMHFEFALDRPAVKALVRWRDGDVPQQRLLDLQGEPMRVAWSTFASANGPHAATLILEAEHGVTTEFPLPSWSVWGDDAPWFSVAPSPELTGHAENAKKVTPDDMLPIQGVADDQVGLARVELEYKLGDRPAAVVSLADAKGQARVAFDYLWSLRGLVKTGDLVLWRLRCSDNRLLAANSIRVGDQSGPAEDLKPNLTYLPNRVGNEDRWWSFRIDVKADSYAKQEITAQRDDFQQLIDRVKKQIIEEQQQVQKVRLASHQQPVLTFDQANALKQAHKLNQANQQELLGLGQKAAAIAGLQNLAKLSFDIARRELGATERALVAGQEKNVPSEKREQELTKAEQALQAALRRLAEMSKLNDLLAQDRLDGRVLDKLAHQEETLAKEADALAAQTQSDPKELERLRAEQEKIAAEFQRMAQQNPRLQSAARQARQMQAQKLAKQARSLAMNQRKVSEEAEAKATAELQAKFSDLAKLQRELAGRIATLDAALKAQPAAATLQAPQSAALNAANLLRDGRIAPAIVQQESAENALRRLTGELDQIVAGSSSPRGAVQRLARLQEELLMQLVKVGDDFPRLSPMELRDRLSKISEGQKMVLNAAAKVQAPKSAAALQLAVQQVVEDAGELLKRNDLLTAHAKMEQARDALKALANALPEAATPPVAAQESGEAVAIKKLAGQALQRANEQRELRDATRKLLDALSKSRGGVGDGQLKKDVDQLADQLMKMAQNAGPESKQALGDAAQAAAMAQKAMDKSQTEMKEGKLDDAKKSDTDAALQLEMAGKKLDESAQAMEGAPMPNTQQESDDAALRKSFADSQMKLDQAEQQLAQKPANASAAMKQAAQALKQTAKLAQQRPGAPAPPMGGGESPAPGELAGDVGTSTDQLQQTLQAHAGKSWGELPGELRTRIVQDLRARYGDEYGPIIQRYFQQIADVPRRQKLK